MLLDDHPEAACRVYAPVGGHRDLLAYRVRRLLENGAELVLRVGRRPILRADRTILERPQHWTSTRGTRAIRRSPLPRASTRLSAAIRPASNSAIGRASRPLLSEIEHAEAPTEAAPLIGGVSERAGVARLHSPIDGAPIGRVRRRR